MPSLSTLLIDSSVFFNRLNTMLADQGPITLPGGLTVNSVELRGDASWLYAVASVKGLYTGTVILQSKVSFDNATKRFSLHDLNIQLGEDSFLAKFAGKFVNNFFAEKTDNKLEEVVNEKCTALLNDILSQLKALPLPKGGTFAFDTQSFNLHDLRTDTDGLHFVAELSGQAEIEY